MSPTGHDRNETPRTIAALCERALKVTAPAGLGGLSVAMHTPGLIDELLYASDPVALSLFEMQSLLGEGPSVEAQRANTMRLEGDLRHDPHEGRWVGVGREISRLGVQAVWSVPLQVGVMCLGVLTLHGRRPVDADGPLLKVVLKLADSLVAAMLSPAATDADPQLALSDIPGRRVQIHQAAGMVMVQLGVSLGDAMLALRGAAYGSERPLLDVADDIVHRRLRLDGSPNGGVPEESDPNDS